MAELDWPLNFLFRAFHLFVLSDWRGFLIMFRFGPFTKDFTLF